MEGGIRYSPDGNWIAFLQSEKKPTWADHRRLALMPSSGGTVRLLPETPDERPELLGWTKDGKRLLFLEERGTLSGFYAMGVASGKIERLDSQQDLISDISLDPLCEHIGFVVENVDKAPEAYQSDINGFKPVKISSLNADLPIPPFGKTEVIHWKGTDGLDIEGLLTYPVGYQKGKRVPFLLNIHGGPMLSFQKTFIANNYFYPIAALASKGFAILSPNPRGSAGYGWLFRAAIAKDFGGKDYQDLMAGVDKVISMGVADPERMGVMGWSYGGFMSSWVITQTQRFKAASVGAGMYNFTSYNGTTDIPSFAPSYLGGDSWEQPELYARLGAVNHIGKARTPTLIQHCEGDQRVPISQSYELYNALKRQGVEVHMLVVPRQGHAPNEPKAMLKVMQTNLDWFTKKLME